MVKLVHLKTNVISATVMVCNPLLCVKFSIISLNPIATSSMYACGQQQMM